MIIFNNIVFNTTYVTVSEKLYNGSQAIYNFIAKSHYLVLNRLSLSCLCYSHVSTVPVITKIKFRSLFEMQKELLIRFFFFADKILKEITLAN